MVGIWKNGVFKKTIYPTRPEMLTMGRRNAENWRRTPRQPRPCSDFAESVSKDPQVHPCNSERAGRPRQPCARGHSEFGRCFYAGYEIPRLDKAQTTMAVKRKNPELGKARMCIRGDQLMGRDEFSTITYSNCRKSNSPFGYFAVVCDSLAAIHSGYIAGVLTKQFFLRRCREF